MESSVDLGFIEKCEPWLLTNKFFPSKLGGRPAWLDLEKIPQTSETKCADCDSELTFLCQVSKYQRISIFSMQIHTVLPNFILPIDLCSTGRVRTLLSSHNLHFHLYKSKLLASKYGQVTTDCQLINLPIFEIKFHSLIAEI